MHAFTFLNLHVIACIYMHLDMVWCISVCKCMYVHIITCNYIVYFWLCDKHDSEPASLYLHNIMACKYMHFATELDPSPQHFS